MTAAKQNGRVRPEGSSGSSIVVLPVADAFSNAAWLAAILDAADDAVFSHTLDGVVTTWNASAQRLFGFSTQEMVGRSIATIVPPGLESEQSRVLQQLRTGTPIADYATERLTRNGGPVGVLLTIAPLFDSGGLLVGAAATARDNSGLERAASARNEVEERMRLAVEAAHVGIWDWNPVTRLIVWSDRFAEIFGTDALLDNYEAFERRLHPADRAATREKMHRAVATGGAYIDEYRVERPDGKTAWVEARGRSIGSLPPGTQRMTGTVIDITARKTAEQAREIAERRLQLAARAAKMGFWDWDLVTGRLTRTAPWSASAEHEEIAVDPEMDVFDVHADDRVVTRAAFQQALVSGEEFVQEFRNPREGGTVRWLESRGRATIDTDGRAVRMMGVVVDISDRKADEDLRRLQTLEVAHLSRVHTMGQMASGLAHELNQPLGAILSYAGVCENLARTPADGGMGRFSEALAEVMNETRRAGMIIGRLRSFVRKQEAPRCALDVNDLVHTALAMLDFELRHANVTVALSCETRMTPVWADAIQIEQVLVNLLYNAIQAMAAVPPGQRRLTIATTTLNDRLARVAIDDSGPGMPAAQIEQLFEPFFTTKPQGMGMGLNISRTIVESHGGRLQATGLGAGGMSFSFTLPLEPETA